MTFTLPAGVDAGALIAQLLSYGALVVPIVAAVGAFFLIAKVLKRM
ncbi:MAG: hypothetical protein ABSB94_01385 [Syntrophorhabdales bacterium]|jgi:hypothetical protein